MTAANSDPPEDGGTSRHDPGVSLPSGLPDHYVIEAEIGRGGMGTVYRARDVKHGRVVAIKVLRAEIAQTYGRDRFLREIRTAAGLMHAHIVTLFDSGEAAGTLYFVMPYIGGESLRSRLEREGRLDSGEAIRIARDIAGALDYAHSMGFAHRDIKPENILLSSTGHVWLVDFGIARAIENTTQHLTATGLVLGSPLYASPEQIGNGHTVDHRTDIYSLGCVLYEMLAGAPPFTGISVQAVMVQKITGVPKSLRTTLQVPSALDDIVQRALATRPAARFANAAEFEQALHALAPTTGTLPMRRRILVMSKATRWLLATAAVIAIVIVAIPLTGNATWRFGSAGEPQPLDKSQYVVQPVSVGAGVGVTDAETRLSDALSSWIGITVVDPSMQGISDETLTNRDSLLPVMRRLNAGRFVQAALSLKGDSLRVHLELYDGASPATSVGRFTGVYPGDLARIDRYLGEAVDSLVLSGFSAECLDGGTGTRVLAAITACDAAFSALEVGDLAHADTMFGRAMAVAPGYARPALWLAETRNWIVGNNTSTRELTVVAQSDTSGLTPVERRLARAQSLMSAGEYMAACAVYRELLATDSTNYVAWLGIGECNRKNDTVIRDHGSPSGWTFVSSYHEALAGYTRAFELRPTLLAGYRDRSFQAVRDVFFTSASVLRTGRNPGSQQVGYRAYAALHNDTLVFVPWTIDDFTHLRMGSLPAGIEHAADRNRALFYELTARWRARVPASAAAAEALAVGHELNADVRALDAITEARAKANGEQEKLRLAGMNVWLQVKFSLPGRVSGLEAAAALADSLLAAHRNPNINEARVLLPLAVLRGRANEAARLTRVLATSVATRLGQPLSVVEPSRAVLTFAAMGGPTDSIVGNEREFELALRNSVSSATHQQARTELLTHAAMVALPEAELKALALVGSNGVLTGAQLAFQRRDTLRARLLLDSLVSTRGHLRPSEMPIDGALAEASLRFRLGNSTLAAAVLDSTLSAIRWYPPGRLEDFVRVGTLIRSMLLRAELAARAGDMTTARMWARPVALFWEDADPAFTPLIKRLSAQTSDRQ